ncbi:hypothetical protein E8E14_010410 [Neopestalotiopsis sp. 37M]|nr:hypothetical protein E8E14_010410 [Neopestalotiopsis sp. 37M]
MATSQPFHRHAHEQAWPEKDMTVWDQNRETIRRVFLLENRTLAQVKRILESEHGFPEFRLIDYEVVLREHFGFRKNLKKEDWLAIGYHREQRRQKGKASNVYLQGLLIEKPRVDRAIRRSRDDRNLPYRGRRERVSVEEMRLHLPFNKFAETIKLHYNMDASTSPSPTYTGVHHPSIGSVRLPEHSDFCTNYEALGSSHQNGTARQTITTKERRHDRLTTRNIAFVGGKFEFDKLMRVFFVLSNKQKIHQHEGVEIIEWIESVDLGVLRSLFSLPLSTVAAAWEQLVLISNVLKCQKAFSKLLETGLVIHDGEWLEANAGDVLGTAIWLGLRDWVKRLLKNGLSPEGHLKQVGHTPFLGTINSKYHPYNGERPLVPLKVALLRSDAEIMAELIYYGAPAAWHTTNIIGETLLDRSTDEKHYDMLRCLKVLLDEGVDVDRETYGEMLFSYLQEQSSFRRLGWLPNRPIYLSDLLWNHSADRTYLRVAFDLVSKNSKRINDCLTVPGLYDAASYGCSKLLQYLNSRTTPSGSDRNLLLEITLSQAASRGDLNVSQTLIQMGVDPNVREIFSQTSQRETWRHYSAEIHFDLADQWVPVFQASKNRDTALLQTLFNAGVDCNQHNLLDALLSEGEEQWTNLCAGGYSNVQAVRDTVDNTSSNWSDHCLDMQEVDRSRSDDISAAAIRA